MHKRLTAGLIILCSLGICMKFLESSGIEISLSILVYVLSLLIWLQTIQDALVQENILELKRNKPQCRELMYAQFKCVV